MTYESTLKVYCGALSKRESRTVFSVCRADAQAKPFMLKKYDSQDQQETVYFSKVL